MRVDPIPIGCGVVDDGGIRDCVDGIRNEAGLQVAEQNSNINSIDLKM